MRVTWLKPRLTWKRVLGWLGVKKYRVAQRYSMDFGLGVGDMQIETFGYHENGIFHVTDMKVRNNDKR